MAISRFSSRLGCHLYGRIRRTDFLPVGEEREGEATERGYESLSSDDSEGCGMEYAIGSDAEMSDGEEPWEDQGNLLADFS